MGVAGSGSEILGRQLIGALNIKPANIGMLTPSAMNDSLKDGLIDASFFQAGLPTPGLVELETTHNIRFIPFSDEDIEIVREEYPFIFIGFIPKGTYKNMEEDVQVVTVWNEIICHKDLPEDLVYRLTKATWENVDKLIDVTAAVKGMSVEDIEFITSPLHKGAAKYYKEIGIEIPERILPID